MSTEPQPSADGAILPAGTPAGAALGRRTFLAAAGAAGAGLILSEPARASLTVREPAPAGLVSPPTASPNAFSVAAVPLTLTIGQSVGGGNVPNNTMPDERYDILDDLRASWVRLNWFPTHYYKGNVPTPGEVEDAVVAALQRNKTIHAYFELNWDTGQPLKNYGAWEAIGIAFAEKFSPGSAYLQGQGITDRGIESWACMNEPDQPWPSTSRITPTEHRAVLKGLADGIHSVHPAARVYPGGYLSANRNREYTAHGLLLEIEDLLNNTTLAGIDLHTYHDYANAPIHNTYSRSTQHDFDAIKQACGITRNIELIVTEHNYKDGSVGQGYDNAWAQRYFLPHLFDQLGVVGNAGQGDRATRFAMYWSLFREDQGGYLYGTNAPLSPPSYRVTGSVYKRILTVIHDMRFTFIDPKGSGRYVLEGPGKKVWVFQNIHSSWAPGGWYGPTLEIENIPTTATTLEIWNHTGLIQTVGVTGSTMTVSTPVGYSYLILAR